MITVYFEKPRYAYVVAVFDDEEIYTLCTPALEKKAKELDMIVTESVTHHKIEDVIELVEN